MSRRIQDLQASIQSIEKRISAFDGTPLKPIGDILINALLAASIDQKPDSIEPVLDYVIYIVNRFSELNRRFYFDAYLIQSISALWNQSKIRCSNILPSYRSIWAHEIVQLPYIGKKGSLTHSTQLQLIDLIHFRKKYVDERANLLDYPWLFHEMGHYLISRYGKDLFNLLMPIINKLASTLHLRALADRDVARTRAKNTIDEIIKMWSPASEYSRWTHEIAIDIIGLWSCGPAYLHTFYTDHQDVNPYLIEPYHPPVAIRTYTLIESAQKIGWSEYTKPLISTLKIWERKIPDSEHNRYKTLRDKGLIDSYINKACEYYSDLGIPRLENQDIERISSQEVDIDSPTLTADLVVKAWIVYQEKGDTAYQAWEENVVNEITELVIP